MKNLFNKSLKSSEANERYQLSRYPSSETEANKNPLKLDFVAKIHQHDI
jgi:hypothetical protein